MGEMQRICGTVLTLLPGLLAAQQSAGTELWRLAATTLPIPPALATGGAAAFWNPAQPAGPEHGSVAFEAIETSPQVGAQGVLLTVRARVTPIGGVGLVYGRMSIGDLVRTSLSPDPDPGGIPYYTQTIGVNWSTTAAATTDRKSTRLNSSHGYISYAVFCLKKKHDTVHRLHLHVGYVVGREGRLVGLRGLGQARLHIALLDPGGRGQVLLRLLRVHLEDRRGADAGIGARVPGDPERVTRPHRVVVGVRHHGHHVVGHDRLDPALHPPRPGVIDGRMLAPLARRGVGDLREIGRASCRERV